MLRLTSRSHRGSGDVGCRFAGGVWLRADNQALKATSTPAKSGDTVQHWNDLSNFANNASQATAGTRPTFRTGGAGGQPYLEFSSAHAVAAPDASSLDLSEATVAVIVSNVPAGSAMVFVSKGASGVAFDYEVYKDATNAAANYNNTSRTGPAWAPTGASASLNITELAPTSTRWLIDGTDTNQTGQSNTLQQNSQSLHIGAQWTGSAYTSFMNGRLYEVRASTNERSDTAPGGHEQEGSPLLPDQPWVGSNQRARRPSV